MLQAFIAIWLLLHFVLWILLISDDNSMRHDLNLVKVFSASLSAESSSSPLKWPSPSWASLPSSPSPSGSSSQFCGARSRMSSARWRWSRIAGVLLITTYLVCVIFRAVNGTGEGLVKMPVSRCLHRFLMKLGSSRGLLRAMWNFAKSPWQSKACLPLLVTLRLVTRTVTGRAGPSLRPRSRRLPSRNMRGSSVEICEFGNFSLPADMFEHF